MTAFYKIPKSLWQARGYVSPETGDLVEFTLSSLKVYVDLKDTHNWRQSTGKETFKSQQSIAEATGLDRLTVGKVVRGFVRDGVIEAIKTRPMDRYGKPRGRERWMYRNISKLALWTGTKNQPFMLSTEPSPTQNTSSHIDFDNSDEPF